MYTADRPPAVPSATAQAILNDTNRSAITYPFRTNYLPDQFRRLRYQLLCARHRHLQGQTQQLSEVQVASMANIQAKVDAPPRFEGEMDEERVSTFVWQCENYFALTQIANNNSKARMACMWLTKSAAVWLRYKHYNMNTLSWNILREDLLHYFRPADAHRRARDRLANCRQTGSVANYIDTMRRLEQQVENIQDDEMCDRFVRGLRPEI